jgi:hypothetical protein
VRKEGQACKYHGGASLKGINHPGFKDGKHSKYMMPGILQDKHDDFLSDPDWLTLVNELAVLRTMLSKHLVDLDGVPIMELWGRSQVLWDEAMAANTDGDQEKMTKKFYELGKILKKGKRATRHHDKTLALIYKDVDGIRRLVESEKGLAITKNEMIPIAIVFGIADLFLRSLHEQVVPLDGGQEATKTIGQLVYEYVAKYLGTGNKPDDGSGDAIIEAIATN